MKRIRMTYQAIAQFLNNGGIFTNADGKSCIVKGGINSLNLLKTASIQENIDVCNRGFVTLMYSAGDGSVKVKDVKPEFVEYDASAKLRLFLYLLARDHLALGVIEDIMSSVNRTFDCDPSWVEHWDTMKYSSDHIENWANDTIDVLFDTSHLFPGEELSIKDAVEAINKDAVKAHGAIDDINKEAMDDLLKSEGVHPFIKDLAEKEEKAILDDLDDPNQALKDLVDSSKKVSEKFCATAEPSVEALKTMAEAGIAIDDIMDKKKSKPKSKRFETFQDVISAFSRGDITVNQAREEFGYLPIQTTEELTSEPDLDYINWGRNLKDIRSALKKVEKGVMSNKEFKLVVASRIGQPGGTLKSKTSEKTWLFRLVVELRNVLDSKSSISKHITKHELEMAVEDVINKEYKTKG